MGKNLTEFFIKYFLSFFSKGSPASSVSWWQDGQLIDGSFEEIIPGKSRNTMKVESLHRQHRHTEFTCSGNNNNRSQALSKSVILDLYCKYILSIVKGSSSMIRVFGQSSGTKKVRFSAQCIGEHNRGVNLFHAPLVVEYTYFVLILLTCGTATKGVRKILTVPKQCVPNIFEIYLPNMILL